MTPLPRNEYMSNWMGHTFQSSSGLTEEFALFARQFRAHVKRQLAPELTLVSFNRGHFYVSGFVRNVQTGKYAYFCSDDVRWSNGWHERLLVRTAEHDRDFTGGRNDMAELAKLSAKALELTQ